MKNDQSGSSRHLLTRHQWLGRVRPSAIAAVVGAGLAGEHGFASQSANNRHSRTEEQCDAANRCMSLARYSYPNDEEWKTATMGLPA